MARTGIIWRICCGWLLCCGFLPIAEAAIRTNVSLPSYSKAVSSSTTASIANGTLSLGGVALEGEYIAAATKNVPVRGILGGVEFGLNTIGTGATSILRANAASLVLGASVSALMAGIDWVMVDGVLSKKSGGGSLQTASGQYQWGGASGFFTSAQEACTDLAGYKSKQDGATASNYKVSLSDSSNALCAWTNTSSTGQQYDASYYISRSGSGCPSGATYSDSAMACTAPLTYAPITDGNASDVTTFISAQKAAYVKSLIQEMCAGANGGASPDSCYKAMTAKYPKLTGPATVSGGTTQSTKTVANADGTTSTEVTTIASLYGMEYSDGYFDATKQDTTTVTKDGKPVSTTTVADTTPASDDSSDDSSDDTATAADCKGTDCTAPEYKPLYTKTTDTKEAALDSYSAKVSALPIMSAVSGFFTVSAGGGCPVWTVNTSMAIGSATMPINLNMDEQCQGWFTSVASYARIAILIVASFFAFRIAILD